MNRLFFSPLTLRLATLLIPAPPVTHCAVVAAIAALLLACVAENPVGHLASGDVIAVVVLVVAVVVVVAGLRSTNAAIDAGGDVGIDDCGTASRGGDGSGLSNLRLFDLCSSGAAVLAAVAVVEDDRGEAMAVVVAADPLTGEVICAELAGEAEVADAAARAGNVEAVASGAGGFTR